MLKLELVGRGFHGFEGFVRMETFLGGFFGRVVLMGGF